MISLVRAWQHNVFNPFPRSFLNNPGKPSQYHVCWCPGSWRRQDISRHDIDNIISAYPNLSWRESFINLCLFNAQQWYKIQNAFLYFFKKKSARKGLSDFPHYHLTQYHLFIVLVIIIEVDDFSLSAKTTHLILRAANLFLTLENNKPFFWSCKNNKPFCFFSHPGKQQTFFCPWK